MLMRIEWLGETAVLVVVGEGDMRGEVAADVRRVVDALRAKRLAGVTDIVPSYCTVGVHYDRAVLGAGARGKVQAWIEERAAVRGGALKVPRREVAIPVCYGGAFGPDLADVAGICGISGEEVVRLHSGGRYEVRAVGFMPGFGYLAGLPAEIAAPRRATPRTRVAAGSVGIAGMQTGVYPLESPGGWQLIGRTPVAMFRPAERRASLLEVGDAVRFDVISEQEFAAWREVGT
jgi:inhibitor of KinA